MRYRLDVVAASVADVVRFAGGWLFDRAMAGWDVTVLLADHAADHPDDRPLQILGARTLDLEDALGRSGRNPSPAPGPGGGGGSVRMRLAGAARRVAGPRSWRHRGHAVGENWPAELDDSVGLVQHRLSMAAQIFKSQALAAARRVAQLDRSHRNLPKRAAGMAVGGRRSGSGWLDGAVAAFLRRP